MSTGMAMVWLVTLASVVVLVLVGWVVALAYYSIRYDGLHSLFDQPISEEDAAETKRKLAEWKERRRTRYPIAGDGVADDTDALQQILDSNVPFFENVHVRLTRPLRIWRPYSSVYCSFFDVPEGVEPFVIEPTARPRSLFSNVCESETIFRILKDSVLFGDKWVQLRWDIGQKRFATRMWVIRSFGPARQFLLRNLWWRNHYA